MNGQENDNEITGIIGTHTTATFWEYDTRLGRRWNVDPVMKDWESPYLCFSGNPIWFSDPAGDNAGKPSTHTDADGKVIAVYNDGDNGVYKHENAKTKEDVDAIWKKAGPVAGYEKVGETEYWDEFVAVRSSTGELLKGPDGSYTIAEGARIMFGAKWDPTIDYLNQLSNDCYDVISLGWDSKTGGAFDIKVNTKYAKYGPNTGKLLDGKYATARSAGNYLAGLNGSSKLGVSTYMNIAGGLNAGGKWGAAKGAMGIEQGYYPFMGEISYSGRMILLGWLSNPNANTRQTANERLHYYETSMYPFSQGK